MPDQPQIERSQSDRAQSDRAMANHPVGSRKDAARLQHPEYLGEQRVLVRHVQQRILGEDDIEGAIGERQRSRRPQDEAGLLLQPTRRGTLPGRLDHRLFDIKTGGLGSAMFNQLR